MKIRRNTLLTAALAGVCLAGLAGSPRAAQDPPVTISIPPKDAPATITIPAHDAPVANTLPAKAPPATMRFTLEEAKQRALTSSKLLNLAALNAQSKEYAIRAARADYFPKVTASAIYLHFNEDLGTVLSTPGRKVTGPKGKPLVTFPPTTINVPVLNEDSSFANVAVLQPITDLLKVRQGVRIAQADQQIAQAELEKGARDLASGVEQLYWGLLAARRIQAGAREGVQGAEMLARTKNLEARTALVEAQQALQQVDKQVADLQEQLNGLLELPLCTNLELVEPALPVLPFHCADDVVGLALAASPEIREAQQTILKAEAALAAGKLDYVPSIALTGGYLNQTGMSYVQQDSSYFGVIGTVTLFNGGKRRNVVRERENLVTMATLKLHETEDEVRQKAVKAFREVAETREARKTAEQMVVLRKEAVKKATTPEAMRDPTPLLKASKDLTVAEVDAVKADLAYREAYVKLMAMTGKP
jgi:outer membrane protein TolC